MKKTKDIKKLNLRKTFLIPMCIAVASQIYLDLFIPNFKISFGIILFCIFAYIYDDINPILTGFISGLLVYGGRVFVNSFINGNLYGGIKFYFPEIFFYISYALFYFIALKINNKKIGIKLFSLTMLCDYFANIVEVLIRNFTDKIIVYNFNFILGLLGIAFIRTCIIFTVIVYIKYNKMLLIKEEQEDRYKKLVFMISKIKTETYWLKKSMYNVEDVMADAYKLYENIQSKTEEENWSESALDLAKDIHEIKKEYALVAEGIDGILLNKIEEKGMKVKELVAILKESMETEIYVLKENIKIVIDFDIKSNFIIRNHYLLMSILRNLFINSIESMNKEKNGYINLKISEHKENYEFIIEDNGCGIEKEDYNYIYEPGFSTKINYETGKINRGLGLSITKDIIENKLKGKIKVQSKVGRGTKFFISISKDIEVN